MRAWLWDLHCLPALADLLSAQADAHERAGRELLALAETEREEAARVREMIEQEADCVEIERLGVRVVRAS